MGLRCNCPRFCLLILPPCYHYGKVITGSETSGQHYYGKYMELKCLTWRPVVNCTRTRGTGKHTWTDEIQSNLRSWNSQLQLFQQLQDLASSPRLLQDPGDPTVVIELFLATLGRGWGVSARSWYRTLCLVQVRFTPKLCTATPQRANTQSTTRQPYIFGACHYYMEVSRVGLIWNGTDALNRFCHEPLGLLQTWTCLGRRDRDKLTSPDLNYSFRQSSHSGTTLSL